MEGQTKKEQDEKKSKEGRSKMSSITSSVFAIAGLALGWAAIELAFKPSLDQSRDDMKKTLDPNYDPDDDVDANNSILKSLR
ncbi:hypothetical protein SUGI_0707910 [Cryptomeria japonica]|uniref:outer envelope membrane protein 7 n=1 Tax=Cryptomeria japonica TaxID=3369 RepID=UPI002414B221|nr:outer envelope membrane protein 7 [Cryptomeria japonica]GLJ35167.1 hypothetical protein SUGI_0707910 [Cryptomeria japonica]